MKRRSKANHRQRELFYEPGLSSVPIPLPLAVNREAELKKAIAELLLNVLDDAAIPDGGERDK
jgi:hypothetical protein